MLLTEALIDRVHSFRIRTMEESISSLQAVVPNAAGEAVGAGYARFAGDGSPLTQACGIAHRTEDFDLAGLDEFYGGLTANWELIVTPFDSPALFREATRYGYVPDHFESVLAQVAGPTQNEDLPDVLIEEVTGDTAEWARVMDAGWADQENLAEELSVLARCCAATPTRRYIARVEGAPAAVAAMVCFDGMFSLGGACTLPQFRGRGLQRALTKRRLADAGPGAFVQGVAIPGSKSHRNMQRSGFSPLYSKLVMVRTP